MSNLTQFKMHKIVILEAADIQSRTFNVLKQCWQTVPEEYWKKLQENLSKSSDSLCFALSTVFPFMFAYVSINHCTYFLFPKQNVREWRGGSRLLHNTVCVQVLQKENLT